MRGGCPITDTSIIKNSTGGNPTMCVHSRDTAVINCRMQQELAHGRRAYPARLPCVAALEVVAVNCQQWLLSSHHDDARAASSSLRHGDSAWCHASVAEHCQWPLVAALDTVLRRPPLTPPSPVAVTCL